MKPFQSQRIETTYIMGRSGREASTYARCFDVLVEFFQHLAPGDYWIRRRLWRFGRDDPRDVVVIEEVDWGVAKVDGKGAFTVHCLPRQTDHAPYDDHDDAKYRRALERRLDRSNSPLPRPGRDS